MPILFNGKPNPFLLSEGVKNLTGENLNPRKVNDFFFAIDLKFVPLLAGYY